MINSQVSRMTEFLLFFNHSNHLQKVLYFKCAQKIIFNAYIIGFLNAIFIWREYKRYKANAKTKDFSR